MVYDMKTDFSSTFEKVTVFVFRMKHGVPQLLTFVHPLAGRQVPAGSVEQDESSIEGAMREVAEETGVFNLKNLAMIGTRQQFLISEAIAVNELHLAKAADLVEIDKTDSIKRGHRVGLLARSGTSHQVKQLLYDFNFTPPKELPGLIGWVSDANLANEIRRDFFFATSGNDSSESWERRADGHDFQVEWVNFSDKNLLMPDQQEWLDGFQSEIFENLESHFG